MSWPGAFLFWLEISCLAPLRTGGN